MDRLHAELQRLYAPTTGAARDAAPDAPPGASTDASPVTSTATSAEASDLVGPDGQVRAIVLGLARPADWQALASVWQGVQADLALPAPAIAVNGQDSCQLWFSLAQPVPAAQAQAFADALRRRWLGDIRPERVTCLPMVDAVDPKAARHAASVPAPQAGSERWSAFVAPDLAPVFAAEPWLDVPPNPDGQARLLAGLVSITPADFRRALAELQPAAASAVDTGSRPAAPLAHVAAADGEPASATVQAAAADAHRDPRRFLQDVMHDERVPLALRIEAAKALLLATGGSPPALPRRDSGQTSV